jgi:hypothetical protein
MKKRTIYAVFSLFLLIFFSCGLQFPEEIQVVGNAEIRLAANMSLGELFTDILAGGIGNEYMTVLSCSNTQYQTFVIHMNLLDEVLDPLDLPEGSQFSDLNWDIPILYDINLIPQTPMTLPLSSLGDLLYGFSLQGVESRLYFSGTGSVLDKLNVGLTINGGVESVFAIGDDKQESDFANWGESYTGTTPPVNGMPIVFPMDGDDVEVEFRIFIPGNQGYTISTTEFSGTLKVELVIWLPLIFAAGSSGADITLPDGLFPENDLFGRQDPYDANLIGDFVEELGLEIVFNENPFANKRLIIRSGSNIEFENILGETAFNLSIDSETMEQINDPINWPFVPRFTIEFGPGETLSIPQNLVAQQFAFMARINATIGLGGN